MNKLKDMNIFNLLRGIACICIILHHCYYVPFFFDNSIQAPLLLSTPPWVGVWIFFIISGYLIGKGFINERYSVDKPKDFLKFYVSKAIRILPIYFLVIFIDLFFVSTKAYFDLDTQMLVRAFTVTIGNPHLTIMTGNIWFIGTLVQLYLVAPLVYKFIIQPISNLKNSKLIYGILTGLILAIGFAMRFYYLGKISWPEIIYQHAVFNADFFICGFLFNYLTINNSFNKIKKILMPCSLVILGIFIVINTVLMQDHWYLDIGARDLKVYAPALTIIIILLTIYAFDFKREKANKSPLTIKTFLNPLKWFEGLGIISFGFFINQTAIIYKLNETINIQKEISINIPVDLISDIIRINISAQTVRLYIIAFFAIIFSVIWGCIIHFMIEKQLNKFRYNRTKLEKLN